MQHIIPPAHGRPRSGSALLVRMHCVDSDFLQVSASTLVYQLTIVMQTMQHLIPPAHGWQVPCGHGGFSYLSPELPPMALKSPGRVSCAATDSL